MDELYRVGLRLIVVVVTRWLSVATLGPAPRRLLQEEAWLTERQEYPAVFPTEVLIEQSVHNGVQAGVEVRHEITHHEQPVGDHGRNTGRVHRYRQANQIQRRPADGEQHEDDEHGQEVTQLARTQPRPGVAGDPPPHAQHQHPNPQVAEGDHGDGKQEVHGHHGDGVTGARRLTEGAGINPGVIRQGAQRQVREDGEGGEDPHQRQQRQGPRAPVHSLVRVGLTDEAVAVDGDGGDVEDGADDARSHQETAHLAFHLIRQPARVQHGVQNQRVRIADHEEVGESQAHYERITCRTQREKKVKYNVSQYNE